MIVNWRGYSFVCLQEDVLQFAKYILVGFSGLFVETVLIFLLTYFWGVNKYVANTLGMLAGMINNYIFNLIFTFHVSKKILLRFLIYFLIWIFVLAISNLVIWILDDLILSNFEFISNYGDINVSFWIAKVVSIGVATTVGYLLHKKFSFKKTS